MGVTILTVASLGVGLKLGNPPIVEQRMARAGDRPVRRR